MMRLLQTKPYSLNDEEGQSLQSLGARVSVKASSEQTGGVFNLFEVSCAPDYATPLHIHYAEDVAVYVLEGALTIFWGTRKRQRSLAHISFSREARRMDFGWKA